MLKIYNKYIETFSGLSKEVWWLAFITLINRAGTMVVPFLSLYLTEDLKLTLPNVGWIMTSFGLGSVIGTWIGGKLTDKIGYYKVMIFSLFVSGFLFIAMQYLKSFASLCIGIFVLMLVADLFRPAMYVALSAYSKPENKTRSVTLVRLAINFGFSVGPAVGGLIIANLGYGGLFWVDGITCVLASLVLVQVLNPKTAKVQDEIINPNPVSVYKDKAFIIFFFAMIIFGLVFLQYFSPVTIYYKQVHLLSEFQVGLLLGFNGLFIFLFEMPLINWLENSKYTKVELILFGAFLTGISFLVLNFTNWSGILVIGMFLMTLGEMIAFPFANAFAMQRAKNGNQGEYMAMYVITFSIASIFGFNMGLQLIAKVGYNLTWNIMAILSGWCVLLLFFLKVYLKKTKKQQFIG